MEQRNGHIYEFAEFRLIPEEGLLLRNGSPISLAPKAFSTLVLLVEEHGHLVEKTELIDRIWENAFVEEAAVSRCIWTIRNALGEDSKDQKFIQTISKRGYRFVADVTSATAHDLNSRSFDELDAERDKPVRAIRANVVPLSRRGMGSVSTAPDIRDARAGVASFSSTRPAFGNENAGHGLHVVPESRSARRSSVFVALGLLAALVVGVGTYYYFSRPSAPAGAVVSRLAVLPLKPLAAENRDPIAEFAIAESLILKLSSSKNLGVRPLTAVRKYVELDRDPIESGRELNVDFVLSSNYQIVNGKIRVTSQLWNVRTGQAEATYKSEGDTAEAFTMRDSVVNEIGNAVSARFGGASDTFAAKRGTSNEEAYRLYMQGMYLTEKYNRPDAAKAIGVFDEALKLDPTYAAAWAGKAHAHCNFAHRGGNAPRVEFANAEPALEKALAIDSNNADAYAVRGVINRDYHWNFAKAYAYLDRALELDPNHVLAHRVRSGLLTRDGRHDEAIIEQKKAIDLNPSAIGEHWLYADALIQARRYDDAIHQGERVREMDNRLAAAYYILWVAYHFKGDHLLAYENFLQNKRLSGSSEGDIAKLDAAFRDSGWLGVLRADRDARIAKMESDYSPAKYYIAGLSAVLGDNEQALKYLNECLENRLIGLSSVKVDPFLDSLRGDSQFEEIVRKAGF